MKCLLGERAFSLCPQARFRKLSEEQAMKFTLGKKLALGFGVILALMVVSSTMSYLKSAAIKQIQDAALDRRVPSLDTARKLKGDLNQTASKARQAMLAGTDAKRREEAKKLLDDAWNAIDKDIAKLDELAPGWTVQAHRDQLAEIKKQLPKLHEFEDRAIEQAASGERDAIVKAGNDFSDKAIPVNDAIKAALGDMEAS
ncbi:MAG: MCP four helix bundle domain-containing protein, partial [Terriglobales bacterium]